jgi:hypothetical protein
MLKQTKYNLVRRSLQWAGLGKRGRGKMCSRINLDPVPVVENSHISYGIKRPV